MANQKKIQSDLETALWKVEVNNELKSMGIELYSVDNAYDGKHSAPIVERLNRTMNDYMKEQEVDHPNKSNKEISEFVASTFPKRYNITKHSTIKTTPNSAFNGTTSTSDVLGAVFHKAENKMPPPKETGNTKNNYKIGDIVYAPLPTGARGAIVGKGVDKWDRTPYKIEKIINSNPPTYIVNGNKYYAQQLRKATK